jgi:hypothetical protein
MGSAAGAPVPGGGQRAQGAREPVAVPRLGDVLRADIGRLSRGFSRGEGRSTLAYRLLSALLYEKRGHQRYRMKILYCPPLGLVRGARPHDGSSASFLHAFYLRELWRERGVAARLRLLAALALWPFVTASTMVWFTWLNGAAVARRTGTTRSRQMLEQLRVAMAHDILPPWYYIFELFHPDLRARAPEYLHRFETKGGLFRYVKRNRGARRTPLADKLRFAARCREHDVPTAPVLFAAAGGKILHESQPGNDPEPRLPDADLFVKPTSGRGGLGAQRWCFEGDGRYRDGSGTGLTREELLARVLRLSLSRPCLVQPRLENHPEIADLSNGALSTVRILTIQNEHGEFEPTYAVLRMAVGPNTTVDNFHAGGIAAKVDLRTGQLGSATDIGLRPDVGWCDVHPDTQAKILGRRLPFWPETLELATRAHAAFDDRIVIGWDIALLGDGPVVIEGNGGPDLDILQRCCREPLGNSRFGELLAFHLRRAVASP